MLIMTHNVTHMIVLQYREKPLSRVWKTAYRMHLDGLENMISDAKALNQRLTVHKWKIMKEETATGAVVQTMARETVGADLETYKTTAERALEILNENPEKIQMINVSVRGNARYLNAETLEGRHIVDIDQRDYWDEPEKLARELMKRVKDRHIPTELTPEGEQAVIPGCERNLSPKATQLDLF